MNGQRVIALLGRSDAPTDAVEEYCRYLGEAMAAEGFELIIERVAWPQEPAWQRMLHSRRSQSAHGQQSQLEKGYFHPGKAERRGLWHHRRGRGTRGN